ncbi:hypothetical protein LIA77_11384 [Sarocladium implicatum]|nr:hypothetical protein LIA77_11384 [Sarocladium implicatum]
MASSDVQDSRRGGICQPGLVRISTQVVSRVSLKQSEQDGRYIDREKHTRAIRGRMTRSSLRTGLLSSAGSMPSTTALLSGKLDIVYAPRIELRLLGTICDLHLGYVS